LRAKTRVCTFHSTWFQGHKALGTDDWGLRQVSALCDLKYGLFLTEKERSQTLPLQSNSQLVSLTVLLTKVKSDMPPDPAVGSDSEECAGASSASGVRERGK